VHVNADDTYGGDAEGADVGAVNIRRIRGHAAAGVVRVALSARWRVLRGRAVSSGVNGVVRIECRAGAGTPKAALWRRTR
jgi:hypothetical protein